MEHIRAQRLRTGDTIGVISPCYTLEPDWLGEAVPHLESMGFRVKFAKNAFSHSWEFAGSAEERAEDFNAMFADGEVKCILFGGGEVCNEILPLIDYEAAARHPKILCSFSDSTTLLNAVAAKTGLVTFNGASVATFDRADPYNVASFRARLMSDSLKYEKSGEWTVIRSGSGTGRLIGGYLVNFALLQNTAYLPLDKNEKVLLFIEDHESFCTPPAVARNFAHLEQSGIFGQAAGLIWGHYSDEPSPVIDQILTRLGDRYHIPVVKTDDFGHGEYNAILPIGVAAHLDADIPSLELLESGVL